MRSRAVAVVILGAIFVAHSILPADSFFASPDVLKIADVLKISEAAAAGPGAGGSLTVLALESKSVRRSSSKSKAEKYKPVARVSKKSTKAVRVASVSNTSIKRAKLTKAGSQAVARRSASKVIRVRGKARVNSSAKLTRVSLDDALQSPSAGELAQESIAGTRFVRQRSTEPVQLALGADGLPAGTSLKNLIDNVDAAGHVRDVNGNTISLTIDPALQQTAESLLMRYGAPWGAIVAVDPRTGALKAAASYSTMEPNGVETATRGGFPAASLFKMITSATAVEKSGLAGDNVIAFRGGNYTLGYSNYIPDARKDRRFMSLAEALGRSCNPVFARVALNNFSSGMLGKYAEKFGFNQEIPFDVPLARSVFTPPSDHYEFARTAAGFGDVTVTPVHAASIMGALSNGGVMMRPYLVSQIRDKSGELVYSARNMSLRSVVRPETAKELMNMMQSTVENGTARKGFRGSFLNNIPVAGKTGTLSGQEPKGVYHWFVASIPANAPEIAISVLVINPGHSRANSVQMGRQFLERAYRANKNLPIEANKEPAPAVDDPADGVS